MSDTRTLIATTEAANDAARAARPAGQSGGTASRMRQAIIQAADGGVYTVGLVGADGGTVDSIPGVRVWGAGSFTVGDRVLVTWIGERPIPWIAASGGGETATYNFNVAGYVRFFTA